MFKANLSIYNLKLKTTEIIIYKIKFSSTMLSQFDTKNYDFSITNLKKLHIYGQFAIPTLK